MEKIHDGNAKISKKMKKNFWRPFTYVALLKNPIIRAPCAMPESSLGGRVVCIYIYIYMSKDFVIDNLEKKKKIANVCGLVSESPPLGPEVEGSDPYRGRFFLFVLFF